MRLSIGFLMMFLLPSPVHKSSNFHYQLIVWNVGQGQWITVLNGDSCVHFDAGGEKFPTKLILKICKDLNNIIYLTHGDWDHINALKFFRKNQMTYCLQNMPSEKLTISKEKLLKPLKLCKKKIIQEVKAVNPTEHCKYDKSSNCFSWVFSWDNKVLVPGDSPAKMEKFWLDKVGRDFEILILGHHGSATSTSDPLLKHIKKCTLAISSSRRAKYGHPSSKVVSKLRQFKIPLLTTEQWGHLIIEL